MENDILDAALTDILEENGFEPGGSGGHLQSIGQGLYEFTMPDGKSVIVDESGHILQ